MNEKKFKLVENIKGIIVIRANQTALQDIPLGISLGTLGKFTMDIRPCVEESGSIVISTSTDKQKLLLQKGDIFNLQIKMSDD